MPEERAQPAAPETQAKPETQKPAAPGGAAVTQTVIYETRLINSVQEEVEKALPRLPDVFDKLDIGRILGWEPHRATLHRTLQTLQTEKKIAVESQSRGRFPTRYRKLQARAQGV